MEEYTTSEISAEFDGRVEHCTDSRIEGWAWNRSKPEERLEIEIFAGSELLGKCQAGIWRADLELAGIGDGAHAFTLIGSFTHREVSARISGTHYYLRRHPIKTDHELLVNILDGGYFFDVDLYQQTNADVKQAGIDPFSHYRDQGWQESRSPNYYFDPKWYVDQSGAQLQNADVPVTHYLRIGEAANYRPVSYFDPSWYRNKYLIPSDESPLLHYLENVRKGAVSPIPEFDVDYYLLEYPDVKEAGIDPFRHFWTSGFREGRNPSGIFDSKYYARRYLNGTNDVNPLQHFIENRGKEILFTHPDFAEKNWSSELRYFSARGPSFEEFRGPNANLTPLTKLLAFYLPQFHAFPENDRWWGKGFTEWTNVARAAPRFEGHFQPRIPRDLGFYDLTNERVIKEQISLAKSAGLSGFIFYFYWFAKKRLMERPLNLFLSDQSLEFPFCVMWANENWTRRWDGFDRDVLIAQEYNVEDDHDLIDTWVKLFSDVRYIRVDGRPLIMIYRPGVIPGIKEKLTSWRRALADENEDPIFVMAQGFGDLDPREFQFDGAVEFPPHKLAAGIDSIERDLRVFDPEFSGSVVPYDEIVSRSLAETPPPFPLIKTVIPSWDNDARRQGNGMTIQGSTPDKYQEWLEQLVIYSRNNTFFGDNIVCVNAWNEWAEGAYLEPDVFFGAAYLNATSKAVFGEVRGGGSSKICLVGHDAHPHGAQLLLKNIADRFVQDFGIEVDVVLLSGGKLADEYVRIAPLTIVTKDAELRQTFARLFRKGYRYVIVNSSASTSAIEAASSAGMFVVLLVHELPSLIKEKKLAGAISKALPFVRKGIFPARFVAEKFERLFQNSGLSTLIMPQGCYMETKYSLESRVAIRSDLGLDLRSTLVLCVGYADLRKGFDLFLSAWRVSRNAGHQFNFVWVGGIDDTLRTYLSGEIEEATETGSFHLLPFTKDVASFYSAADVFLLTSREDPYPTVVLESLQAGVPVVAFNGSGGIPELLASQDFGRVVPMGDVYAAVQSILDITRSVEDSPTGRASTSARAREAFSFSDYAFQLATMGPQELIRVSVVVPNFNYAQYLSDRMETIFAQSYPVYEIIVLDDSSSDESLQRLTQIQADSGRRFKVIRNEVNSGSVFRQWQRAVNEARGDYLWIAEADDLSEPDFLANLTKTVIDDPTAVLAFCDSRSVDEFGRVTSPSYKGYLDEVSPATFRSDLSCEGELFVENFLSERNIIMNVSGCLWRRFALSAAIEDLGSELFDYKVAGDWRLYVAALMKPGVRVHYCAKTLNVHRRHTASVTSRSLSAASHIREISDVQKAISSYFNARADLLERQAAYLEKVSLYLNATEG